MVKMLKLVPLCALLFITGAIAVDESDTPVDELYLNELKKLERHLLSPELNLVSAAADEYGTYYPPSEKRQHIVLLPEALARQVSHKVARKSQEEFDDVYDSMIVRPCEHVNMLSNDFNSFLDQHPELANWAHQVGMLPGNWYKISAVCERQLEPGVRRRVYQQFELMKI